MSQSSPIVLAEGHITSDDRIIVELVDLDPPAVLVHWPKTPTRISPARYDQVIAQATRLLANASTELAARRRPGRRPKLDL